jgi:hypothetical protein
VARVPARPPCPVRVVPRAAAALNPHELAPGAAADRALHYLRGADDLGSAQNRGAAGTKVPQEDLQDWSGER